MTTYQVLRSVTPADPRPVHTGHGGFDGVVVPAGGHVQRPDRHDSLQDSLLYRQAHAARLHHEHHGRHNMPRGANGAAALLTY